jgi:ribonucleoside-diphosphate reductase subunit M2
MDDNHKPTETFKKVEKETKPSVAVTVRPTDEPILQENPQRFVLFPIKYHEVCEKFPLLPPWTRFNA